MVQLDRNHGTIPNDEAIVSKAVIKAARKLDMSNVELSDIIGISEPQLSRIANSSASNLLKKDSKEYELSLLFIRMFRSLDALVGGDDASAIKWMRGRNLAFNQKPIERVKTIEGLIDVLSYLDSRRAPV
jgi:hypothetical protein